LDHHRAAVPFFIISLNLLLNKTNDHLVPGIIIYCLATTKKEKGAKWGSMLLV
jgi:hypothetical protein